MRAKRFIFIGLLQLGLTVLRATAQPVAGDADQIWLRQHERDEQLRRTQSTMPDVRIGVQQPNQHQRLPAQEQPCFIIEALRLDADEPERFAWLTEAANVDADGHSDPAIGRCIGSDSVQIVLQRMQQALLRRGLVTTRVLVPPQDLSGRVLTVTVLPGRVRTLRFADGTPERATMGNAMPLQPGDLLDLRALEQGLENFRRSPSVAADVQIQPSEDPAAQPGDSDVVVRWAQARPWRVNVSIDDAGSRATGRLQSAVTVAVDHPLALNDLVYLTISGTIGDRQPGPRDAGSRTMHYSLPWRDWLIAATHSEWDYFQSVAGRNGILIYSGASQSSDITISRLLHRDATRKMVASLRLWRRWSRNHIDDAELEQQRRRTGGWELALSHRAQIGSATLDANAAVRRGTGAFGATAAPEEDYGEGSSRLQLLRADAALSWPFTLGAQALRYSAALRRQWNHTPLTPQDRFAIGNRYTVRGFDGESLLSGDRGWLLRQEIGWSLAPLHSELYLGLDTARISGQSTRQLAGSALTGIAIGIRGTAYGLAWDAFIGQPRSHPEGFRTASTTAGFYLSASY